MPKVTITTNRKSITRDLPENQAVALEKAANMAMNAGARASVKVGSSTISGSDILGVKYES